MKSRSIQFKIIAVIFSVLSISILTSIIITTQNQRRNLLSTAKGNLAVNTEMLNQVIRNIMLSGEAEIATRTLGSIKGLEGFEEVEIYRTTGDVAFSDYATVDFVNQFQDRVQFDYTERTDMGMADNQAFKTVLQTNSPLVQELVEMREMEYFFPILNYQECRGCHGDQEFIRGVSHFKISTENIYDQVSFAGVVLTAFFVAIGIIIFSLLVLLIRRLVLNKILTIGRTVSVAATGNLDVQISLESDDELGTLSEQINNMISSLKEKKQLEIEHALTETSLKENKKYLQNIQEGLLMVDSQMIINENYSHFLKKMFGEKQISGIHLGDFLFPENDENSELRQELHMFIGMLFNNTTADMEMIADINPVRDCWIDTEKGKILIDGFFQRVFDEENNVENVMIIFKDKTGLYMAEKELKEERERAQSELDYIAALLKAGPQTFQKFLREAKTTLNNFKEGISQLENRTFVDKSFREIHSLKGSAAYFNFRAIEKISHLLETELKEYKTDGIEENLELLFKELENIENLLIRFRDFATTEKGELDQFIITLESMLFRLSEDLGKKIHLKVEKNVEEIKELDGLKNALIHLVRNSADHGVEDPIERISSGKEEEATITIHIEQKEQEKLDISVSDDGRGIDYAALEKKARSAGYLKDTEKAEKDKLIKFIFLPGFSTRGKTSKISGRGVGLDAVRDDVHSLGGKIGISSVKGKGSKFTIHLKGNK